MYFGAWVPELKQHTKPPQQNLRKKIKIMSSTKADLRSCFKIRKILQIFGWSHSPSKRPQHFLQSLDLVHPESILAVFKWPKSIKHFRVLRAQRKRVKKMGLPVVPELFVKQACTSSAAKLLRDEYQPNSFGNVSCPFQLEVSWMASILNSFQILDNMYLGDMSPELTKSPQ